MHDQPSLPRDPLGDAQIEHLVLHMLQEPGGPPMWSMSELALELGDESAAADAVANLRGTGLVHRCGAFVFPTRATMRLMQLDAVN